MTLTQPFTFLHDELRARQQDRESQLPYLTTLEPLALQGWASTVKCGSLSRRVGLLLSPGRDL